MSQFVLDNSVTMRWLLASQKKADQVYAERVLRSLVDTPSSLARRASSSLRSHGGEMGATVPWKEMRVNFPDQSEAR